MPLVQLWKIVLWTGHLQLHKSRFTIAQFHFTTAHLLINCTIKYALRGEASAAVDFGAFWTSLWCVTATPDPAVCNQVNIEKNILSVPWPWAYFTNGPNAAASIAPTLIRHWQFARTNCYCLMCGPLSVH